MTALGSVSAGYDTDSVDDVRRRHDALLGLLVHVYAHREADRFGGMTRLRRDDQRRLYQQARDAVWGLVTAPDHADEFVAGCREIGREQA